MNLTRWSARLPGGQRRAAPPAEPGTTPSVPAARELPDQPPEPAVRHEHADHEHLPVRDVLSHLPALVAVSYGPSHRMAYLSRAWTEVFGHRPIGIPAAKVLPELRELGLLPLMDQVYRTGRARTVKARKVPHTSSASANGSARYYTFVCAPVRETEDLGEQLAALTSAGNTPAHGTRVLGGLGAFTSLRRSTGASDVCGVLVFGAEVTDQVQVTESLRESERRHREAAVTLQRSLLPQKLEQPDDLRVAATYQPGGADAAVGGDWYDVITLGGGRTALVIGDVMGRGMRAAAVMGQLRTAVRAYARLDLPPHEVLQLLDGLASEIDATQIATCLYAVFDPSEQRLTYASAGHLPLMIRQADGTVLRQPEPCGPPLGTGGWLHSSSSMAFPTGATGVLYTDGLVERRDQDIDRGLDALARTLKGAAGHPEVVCSRLLRAMGVGPQHDDDVAVLAFQLPEREPEASELFRSASLDLLGGTEAAASARAFTTGVLSSWQLDGELHDMGVLAVSELVSNSLMHGHPPTRLRLRRTDRRLTVEVTDADEHLPSRKKAEPADESGRGIAIVAAISNSWGSRRTPEGGKAVWCEFDIARRHT
ncbi:ATP-binding SpoIIE family protein phosphatase [Streptacidiphilus monticola]|uniref:SpoIIE family protein phosphatase n=1 Tax=Streptacidiphilus monticola TaxID=2161674 RepID=A0ABW1FZK5_9ACTN